MYEREPGGGVWVEHPPDQVLGVAGHPRPLLSGEVDATTEDRLHDLLVVVCICLFVAQCSFGRSEEKGKVTGRWVIDVAYLPRRAGRHR